MYGSTVDGRERLSVSLGVEACASRLASSSLGLVAYIEAMNGGLLIVNLLVYS